MGERNHSIGNPGKNIKVPVGFQVGLGFYFTAPNVNTQAIKQTSLASIHLVGWWVVVGWLVARWGPLKMA